MEWVACEVRAPGQGSMVHSQTIFGHDPRETESVVRCWVAMGWLAAKACNLGDLSHYLMLRRPYAARWFLEYNPWENFVGWQVRRRRGAAVSAHRCGRVDRDGCTAASLRTLHGMHVHSRRESVGADPRAGANSPLTTVKRRSGSPPNQFGGCEVGGVCAAVGPSEDLCAGGR